MITEQASIETVQLLILESFPVQVNLQVTGNLPDDCSAISQIDKNLFENSFQVNINISRQISESCVSNLIPFDETIPLDVLGLQAGEYFVNVNGVQESFILSMDNIPQVEPDPGEGATGSISGTVWHDLCAIAGGEGGELAVPSQGCSSTSDGGFIANGLREAEEPGLSGLVIDLGSGACPSSGLMTFSTDSNGSFVFSDLPAGTYCVSLDSLSSNNQSVLLPGEWTLPAGVGNVAEITVNLPANQKIEGVDFGWDYQFLPEPTDPSVCTDKASFVTDISVPDDTEFSANEVFKKTWRLSNEGSCPWTENYSLAYASGDQMDGPSSLNLIEVVQPGDTIDLTIELIAPASIGTYQGFWQLQNDSGSEFGLGVNGDEPFWVQIMVTEGAPLPELGAPSWQDTFADGRNWGLYDDDHTIFAVEEGRLMMTAKNPDWWDGWMLSPIEGEDFYLSMEASQGQCDGFDHFGLFFRAPEDSQGYLFAISCSGYFSLRNWDGENFSNIQEWTLSSKIKAGTDQTNNLLVKVSGDEITLYVNGEQIAQISDPTYENGKFGPFIGAVETAGFKVEVDSISFWEIEG
jgi:hypothetical protein